MGPRSGWQGPRGAREGLAELAKMEEALEAEKKTLEGKRKDLEDLITAVGEAVDFEEALQEAKLKQELLRARDGMLGQLRREHLDLAALARRIEETARDHPWMLDPEEVEACRLELENLEDERSNLKEELGSLTKEIERFRDKVSAGELEGQIQALDERIEAEKAPAGPAGFTQPAHQAGGPSLSPEASARCPA